ncbi:MAG: succinyl-diaminopimelate desuccinylase [Gammaproteobacteria bacterium]|nr:MAG: succinyl-diaminopimelate desuccinylase [Gammaproteobacteria bacterium]
MSKVLELTKELIKKPSVTPLDEGCQDLIASRLKKLGFEINHLPFGEVSNLWATFGEGEKTLTLLGHTDVVPTGPVEKWTNGPFEPTERDGLLYGRGAADMKGSVAAFVVAAEEFCQKNPKPNGRLSIMLTSDEEGPAKDGVKKVIKHLTDQGEKIDWCLVGEPTAERKLGDVVKIGRRGSINGVIKVQGIQGHAAYPHNAENPIHTSSKALNEIVALQWPDETGKFPDSILQVSNINSGTGAHNVIPGELSLKLNVRYSPSISPQTVIDAVEGILQKYKLNFNSEWEDSGSPFLTTSTTLINSVIESISNVTGINEERSIY